MATVQECEQALRQLSVALAASDSSGASGLDRTISCRVPDLEVIFTGRLRDAALHDLARSESAKADLRLTVDSDDLVRLVDGSLGFGAAWASGRIKVHAGVFDLLRLRTLL
ncbi:hypothetical protein BH20ACT5_BH20ACT5_20880 [soil metagenome]